MWLDMNQIQVWGSHCWFWIFLLMVGFIANIYILWRGKKNLMISKDSPYQNTIGPEVHQDLHFFRKCLCLLVQVIVCLLFRVTVFKLHWHVAWWFLNSDSLLDSASAEKLQQSPTTDTLLPWEHISLVKLTALAQVVQCFEGLQISPVQAGQKVSNICPQELVQGVDMVQVHVGHFQLEPQHLEKLKDQVGQVPVGAPHKVLGPVFFLSGLVIHIWIKQSFLKSTRPLLKLFWWSKL